MFSLFKKRFDPQSAHEPILNYVEDVLKGRLNVEPGTPAEIQPLPSPPRFARRRIGFGRGRDFEACFYPAEKKFTEGDERVALNDLLLRRVPVPVLAVEDRTPATRKKFGFDAVVCRYDELRAPEDAWTADDLRALADLLRQIHTIASDEGGRAWNPANAEANYLKTIENRWIQALEAVAQGLGRRVNPVREAPFREKAFGRLENAPRYDLVHGAAGPSGFQRPRSGGLSVGDMSSFHFGYREWDLVLVEQLFFGGECPASRSLIAHYLQQTPPATAKRYELLRPFFTGLYHLESMAATVPDASKSGPAKAKPLTPAEQMEESGRRAAATQTWEAFLAATELPEK